MTAQPPAEAVTLDDPAAFTWTPPGDDRVRELLRRTRSVTVVGASANPARASNEISRYLITGTEYDVHFVNPRLEELLGRPVYDSVAEVPGGPDLVTAFRRVDTIGAAAAEIVDAGARTLWLQLGLWHEPAASLALEAGLDVVMDRCVMVEHRRLLGPG
ncbi:CoA-binding protein [Amycolatopsis antarctica]|uniref:CoA-binding protein n=1 Tax=Amycolatopsis antarctica TaxID=1854586 RepID=A0A263D7Y7_9PSEU|nr:CoA-binding protein [Amycolatopsis antarctica]OZM74118.1 CoA-binding protein [Amycolatopsis antarctica]